MMVAQKFIRNYISKLFFLGLILIVGLTSQAFASDEAEGEKFKPSEMIRHHISDSHEWHFFTSNGHHYSAPLPIILYSQDRGIELFSSARFHGEHGASAEYNGYKLEHEHIIPTEAGRKVYDFSITKNVTSMFIGAFLLLLIFFSVARGFKKNQGKAPKGIQSFFEPLIIYVRDDIAIPNIGEAKYMKYLPYLLTLFFFVWINNILGLLPTGANMSGNIAFTLTLAVLTAIITNISGKSYYWKHIFMPPGVPLVLYIIMVPVEIIGIITKPFALMIRLFANITAGHIIILSLLSFIFIFKSFLVGIPAGIFVILMTFLELFVAALQAYIFTLLTALFIGTAIEEPHHGEADH